MAPERAAIETAVRILKHHDNLTLYLSGGKCEELLDIIDEHPNITFNFNMMDNGDDVMSDAGLKKQLSETVKLTSRTDKILMVASAEKL